jgi:competence ComEA-like helix-hairpin-helix protein
MNKVLATAAAVFFVVAVGIIAHAASIASLETAGVININTATEDQLRMLPLVNEQLVRDIIAYRNSNGPFESIDDLRNVNGITSQKLDELRPWLVIKGDSTFVPDLYNSGSPGPVK